MAEKENKAVLATTGTTKLPALKDLVELADTDKAYADNALAVWLNQDPPEKWVKLHPIAKMERVINGEKKKIPLPYIPIERQEYLLTRIFLRWWVEVKSTTQMANAVVVVVRVYVIDPITKEERWNDGIGAVAIQTDSGAGPTDWGKIKNNGVQLAAPSAESYAFKDAVEKFGRVFGKDLARVEQVSYMDLLAGAEPPITSEILQELYNEVKDKLSPAEDASVSTVINDKVTKQYKKIYGELLKLKDNATS